MGLVMLTTGWLLAAPPAIHAIPVDDAAVQAFELDLLRVRLRIARARGLAPVAALAAPTRALLAVNGGFFDRRHTPLGLRVSDGQVLSPLRRADWGVLTVTRGGRARLVHMREYVAPKGLDFAIQAGPRLVVAGRALRLRPQSDRRTAIGIRPGGRTLVLVVADRAMLLQDLAELLRARLGCPFALNLDGGSSTQLWSRLPDVRAVAGLPVADAVLVVPRQPPAKPNP